MQLSRVAVAVDVTSYQQAEDALAACARLGNGVGLLTREQLDQAVPSKRGTDGPHDVGGLKAARE